MQMNWVAIAGTVPGVDPLRATVVRPPRGRLHQNHFLSLLRKSSINISKESGYSTHTLTDLHRLIINQKSAHAR